MVSVGTVEKASVICLKGYSRAVAENVGGAVHVLVGISHLSRWSGVALALRRMPSGVKNVTNMVYSIWFAAIGASYARAKLCLLLPGS